jgi:hypothetical protein
MPILSYFVVAGTFLLGLLFAADAYLPAATPAIASSNFYGLPAKNIATGGTLTATAAPEPDMNSPAVVAAKPVNLTPVNAPSDAMAQAAKPKRRPIVHRYPEERRFDQRYDNHFGWSWQGDNRRWASRGGWWGGFR